MYYTNGGGLSPERKFQYHFVFGGSGLKFKKSRVLTRIMVPSAQLGIKFYSHGIYILLVEIVLQICYTSWRSELFCSLHLLLTVFNHPGSNMFSCMCPLHLLFTVFKYAFLHLFFLSFGHEYLLKSLII